MDAVFKNFFVPDIVPNSEIKIVDDLPKVVVSSNWRPSSTKLPTTPIRQRGEELEELAAQFVDELLAQNDKNQMIALAGEMNNEPGVSRPLRVIQRFQRGPSSRRTSRSFAKAATFTSVSPFIRERF